MLITNEFTISRYLGSQSLSLLTQPSELTPAQVTQYQKFINNTVTIYGNQLSNGTTLIFFKNADQTPSSASTLTSLDPNQEYYIISKSDAVFPYSVPVLGATNTAGQTTECPTSQSGCCPVVTFSDPDVLDSSGQIYAYLTANASGLVPGKSYSYSVNGIGSNWPSRVAPLSGTINPASNNYDINLVFNFSPKSNGIDDSKFLPYNLDPDSDKDYIRSNLYSILELSVNPEDASLNYCSAATDTTVIRCNQCLPSTGIVTTRPTLNFADSPKLSLTTACCASPVPIVLNISNCVPGRQYTYQFSSWPDDTVTISPANGTVGFGDGAGKINAIVNTGGQANSIIRCTVTDPVLSENFSEFLTVQCSTGGC